MSDKFTIMEKFNFFNTIRLDFIMICVLYLVKIRRLFMQQQLIQQTEYALSLLKKGDETGIDILYRCMSGRMLITARGILHDAGWAEDAVQESFVKIVSSAASYKNTGNPCAWILTIVRNTALNLLKKNGAARPDNIDEYEALLSVDSFEEQSSDKIIIHNLIMRLVPPIVRTMIYMKYFLGFTVREIAKQLNVSKSYVSKQILIAKQFMRDNLKLM